MPSTIPVLDPARGTPVGEVPDLDAHAVNELARRARAAQPTWAATPVRERAAVLHRLRRWLLEHADEVIGTVVGETGKTWEDGLFAEIAYTSQAAGFWARRAPGWLADRRVRASSPAVLGRRSIVRYEPHGLVGVVAPWNYPLSNALGDCLPALVAGNAVLLKPSEVTPLTALLAERALRECGLPDGVLQVATGTGETGAAVVDAVDMVMFTGSTRTGRLIGARCGERLIPCSLELGGKDPMIVLADADLDRAANAAVYYGMFNAGQTCISVERVYVEAAVHDAFVERVVERVRALRQGDGHRGPGTVDVGSLTFPPQRDVVAAHVDDARERGARVLHGGTVPPGDGLFYEPTVLVDVDHSMRCMREETFGPTLPIMRVADEEEAIQFANDSEYGLAASVFTRDAARGERVARRLQAGSVAVNDALVFYAAMALPMGGWKTSGVGVRHGAEGLRKYCRIQSLVVAGRLPRRDPHMFPNRAGRSRLLLRALRVAAVAAALLPGAAKAAPPPLEPIEIEREIRFALPEGVRLVDEPRVDLTADEQHLAIGVEVAGADHVAITDLEGNGYRCVTCGHVGAALKPELFHDERRVWFADQSGQSSGGTGDFQWSVLECAPSIYDCARAAVLPVTFPRDSLSQGAQNREARPDVKGEYVGWNEVGIEDGTRMSIARLERRDDGYVLTGQRVWNPPYGLSDQAEDWENGGRFYEGGSPVLGNRVLKYGSTRTASNYEIFELDTLTGRRRPLTTDLDYNEVVSYAPDGRTAWYTSARGLDRTDVVTQLVRPSFLDMVSFGQVGRVFLFQNRRCMNEGWLMDRETGQQLGGYAGQPVLLEDDWNLRRFSWFGDGTRAVTYEQRLPNRKDPEDPAARRRVRIVRLPARRPSTPLPAVDLDDTMMPSLTVPEAAYRGMAAQQVADRVVNGRAAGTATMRFAGTFSGGVWQVRYDGYSDDGRTFVTGTESLSAPNPIVVASWSADLVATGVDHGFLRGQIDVLPQNRFSGNVESEVRGRRLTGIPTQATCPGLRQPQLDTKVLRRRALRGGRLELRVRVTATVPEDATPRPVTHATVQLRRFSRGAGRPVPLRGALRVRTRTDRDGVATLRVRRVPGARYALRADAGSFKSDDLQVRVRRP